MFCNLLRGELAGWGLEGGSPAVRLTEEGGVVVDEGEAKPPGAFGLTTDDDDGDTDGEALLWGDLAGEEVLSLSALCLLF